MVHIVTECTLCRVPGAGFLPSLVSAVSAADSIGCEAGRALGPIRFRILVSRCVGRFGGTHRGPLELAPSLFQADG